MTRIRVQKGLVRAPSCLQCVSVDHSTAYVKLGKSKAITPSSRRHARLDDESVDELVGSALLDSVPDEHMRDPFLYSHAATDDFIHPKSIGGNKVVVEDLDKPLPPLPQENKVIDGKDRPKPRQALSAKTTNLKVSTKPGWQPAKPEISHPVLQHPTKPLSSHGTQASTQTSTKDAADLSRKISSLMQQAADQEAQTKRKKAAYAAETAKPSPLQRGKKVFVKATRAIKDRLSSNSTDKPLRFKSSIPRPPSSTGTESPPEYESDDEKIRLHRRIAEGENLSNPKIRSLTGDGNIPRKPLPVYESMKSRIWRSESSEDPFSDGKQLYGRSSIQDCSGFDFDFDFNKRKNNNQSTNFPQTPSLPNRPSEDSPSVPPTQYLAVPQDTPRFSNMISGLAQHLDTELFSSSPVGFSTPPTRLDPQYTAIGNNRPTGSLARSPSILEFSFEAQSEDEQSEVKSTTSKSASLSVKRKEATEDLRSPVAPANKKPRIDSRLSKEDQGLVAGVSQLGTMDERTPLSPKTTNSKVPDRGGSRHRGLSIFDLGKGKGLGYKDEGAAKRPASRANVPKRSSLPRPNSVLFGRESKVGMRRVNSDDRDGMDVDELQSEDVAFQIGGKKGRK